MGSHDLSINNKLVRDLIPTIRRKAGWIVVERVLENEEIPRILEAKLREEFLEFKSAKTRPAMFEEVADMLAVIEFVESRNLIINNALLRICKDIAKNWMMIFGDRITEVRSAKKINKGEFDNLHFIVYETRTVTT